MLQILGERLHDHWSSGLNSPLNVKVVAGENDENAEYKRFCVSTKIKTFVVEKPGPVLPIC